ncbi:unnamed protein product, partial [Hymenolepis diminuta]
VGFTTLTRLIKSRTLEHSGKCGYCNRLRKEQTWTCAETSTNQQSRSLQPSMVLYLMAKFLTTTHTRKRAISSLHSTSFLLLPLWAQAS